MAGSDRDAVLGTIQAMLAIVREALIIVAVVFVFLFPTTVGSWLVAHGVHSIAVAGAEISLDQFHNTTAHLNTVEQAANDTSAEPQVQATLQKLAISLKQTAAEQVRSLSAVSPGLLPRAGWIYLGTVNADKSGWQSRVVPDVVDRWPLAVGDIVTLSTDVNLRSDSSPHADPQAPIVSVLPSGTRARIRSLDTSRVVPAGDVAAPGFRAWAQIEVAG